MDRGARYAIDDGYIFRHEFFGGLFHSRYGGGKFEASHAVASAVHAMASGRTLEEAERFADRLNLPLNRGDLAELHTAGVLRKFRETAEDCLMPPDEEVFSFLNKQLLNARSRDHLRAPINLSIYPSMKCQLDCTFCFVTDEKWRIEDKQDASQWAVVLREAKAAGVPFVSILGGEPTLFGGFLQLLNEIEGIGIKTTFTTNGLRLTDALVSFLASSKWITPVISIQSLDDYNSVTTGISASKPLRALAILREAGVKCRVNAVYTGQTVRQFEELLRLCDVLGVEKVSVGHHLDLKGRAGTPSFRDSRHLHEQLSGVDSSLDFQLEGCQLYTAYPELQRLPDSTFEVLTAGCEAGNGRGEVMADGTLLPCSALRVENWGGLNVFTDGFQVAWDRSLSFKKIRGTKTVDTECRSCRFGYFCNGGCPAVNELRHGHAFTVGDPRCGLKKTYSDPLAQPN
ncbi:hypothetical protein CO662_28725 [Rhizobium anhuiense]|uniref:Radical SAM core domain-containing protein n=1 Tax=Rhizobium anhuiense TaxID=1184720 RepID=A0ABX4J224_9HYPH|nr:radical SAM protein [Rhizobium anhuiense]PDS48481.1 hypothetical protein CO662_28725 [Rhizobium anhuiense]